VAEALAARAIREEKNIVALVTEILEAAGATQVIRYALYAVASC
jgi:hypothetical protein